MCLTKLKTLPVAALAIGLIVTGVPAAKAGLSCNVWSSGKHSGNTVIGYDCNTHQITDGSSKNSYQCYDLISTKGFCDFTYQNDKNGNDYQGDCVVVITCKDGCSISCDAGQWDGRTSLECTNIPEYYKTNCQSVEVYCQKTPSTCVPEPSTLVAGALLLMPLGVSTVRILRKKQTV